MDVKEFVSRREAIAKGLAERQLDALFVAFSPNVRYLSGFTGSNGALLVTERRTVLFTDPRYTLQAAQEAGGAPDIRVRIAKGPLMAEAAAAINKAKLRRVGYEPPRITCDAYESLQSLLPLGAALQPVSGWIEQLRMIKSAAEVKLIQQSVVTNSLAFEDALKYLRAGVTEQDFAAELEYRMRLRGAEKPAFETIVASGGRSALPHAQPSAARLKQGDLIVVDMGATRQGYSSDMTRMIVLGRAGREIKRIYAAVLEAQQAAVAAVRPGVEAQVIDGVARRVLRRHRLDRAFIHSTGHGLGLEIHERPRIGKRDRTELKGGMAITIEPGVYLEGWGGIRIEDTVLVTGSGHEVLTPTSKELRVV